jgi:peptidoglycan/LPS O-acetylase OafA/YrhL
MASAFPVSHRDDIDGLRAIAVGLVILFHYGVPGFSGGFVGVDVFFVISGFLIGGIIERELKEGSFSFLRFYERRVRRIFPALFAMLFAAGAVAAVLLFPADFVRFGQSALAAALFWSNLHFFNTADYWDVAASAKPLLHTWSLAVEEQFYLVFPLLLVALARVGRRWKLAALATLFVLSFAGSVWAVKFSPAAAFYLAPLRFWEFLMGAGLPSFASLRTFARDDNKFLPVILAAAGLGMILFAGLTLTRASAFPGLGALLPCLGAALLIWAGQRDNAVSRLLSLKPIVFLGLISYSLYLWHWPVRVFAQTWLVTLSPWQSAGCAALTFVLAVLSWRFVEQPFRRRNAVARRPLFLAAAGAMAAVCGFALVVVQTGGFKQRFDPRIQAIMAQSGQPKGALAKCFGLKPAEVNAMSLCGFGAEAAPASFVLWGDSHAQAIMPAVADIARKYGRKGLFAGSPSCAPLMGVDRYDAPDCRAFNDHVLATILAHKEIGTVILMARWGKNAQGTAYGIEGDGFVPIGDDEGRAEKPADNAAIFARGLKRTVAALRAAGKRVVLVGPVPEIGWTVPDVLARLAQEHRENTVVAPPASKFYAREKEVLPLFRHMAAKKGVRAVFPHDYLCKSGRCAVRKNGIPLYRDEHHLSDYGARKLEPLLDKAIDPLFAKVS